MTSAIPPKQNPPAIAFQNTLEIQHQSPHLSTTEQISQTALQSPKALSANLKSRKISSDVTKIAALAKISLNLIERLFGFSKTTKFLNQASATLHSNEKFLKKMEMKLSQTKLDFSHDLIRYTDDPQYKEYRTNFEDTIDDTPRQCNFFRLGLENKMQELETLKSDLSALYADPTKSPSSEKKILKQLMKVRNELVKTQQLIETITVFSARAVKSGEGAINLHHHLASALKHTIKQKGISQTNNHPIVKALNYTQKAPTTYGEVREFLIGIKAAHDMSVAPADMEKRKALTSAFDRVLEEFPIKSDPSLATIKQLFEDFQELVGPTIPLSMDQKMVLFTLCETADGRSKFQSLITASCEEKLQNLILKSKQETLIGIPVRPLPPKIPTHDSALGRVENDFKTANKQFQRDVVKYKKSAQQKLYALFQVDTNKEIERHTLGQVYENLEKMVYDSILNQTPRAPINSSLYLREIDASIDKLTKSRTRTHRTQIVMLKVQKEEIIQKCKIGRYAIFSTQSEIQAQRNDKAKLQELNRTNNSSQWISFHSFIRKFI